jgi:ribosome-associated protein
LDSQVKLDQQPISTEDLTDLIIDSIRDIKGKNILKLDLRKLDDAPTDFFIICEGDSVTQVKAISENINVRLKREASTPANHIEGGSGAGWICMDYFDVVVHIFHPEKREFYQLESLWSDAETTEYASL